MLMRRSFLDRAQPSENPNRTSFSLRMVAKGNIMGDVGFEGRVLMRMPSWASRIAVAGVVAFVCVAPGRGVASVAPHDDPAHKSSLRAILTMTDGTIRTVTLQGVGCPGLFALGSVPQMLMAIADLSWQFADCSRRTMFRVRADQPFPLWAASGHQPLKVWTSWM